MAKYNIKTRCRTQKRNARKTSSTRVQVTASGRNDSSNTIEQLSAGAESAELALLECLPSTPSEQNPTHYGTSNARGVVVSVADVGVVYNRETQPSQPIAP